jgi:transcriptional regulator with XRE-family HTH domain
VERVTDAASTSAAHASYAASTPTQGLSELIMAAHHGSSFEGMSSRARSHGHSITKQYISKLAKGHVQRPSVGKLAALAAAIGVPESTVNEAAARDAGLHVERESDSRTGALLDLVGQLDPMFRDLWFRLASATATELAAARRSGGGMAASDPVDSSRDAGGEQAGESWSGVTGASTGIGFTSVTISGLGDDPFRREEDRWP